jgi:hypothetical protein
MRTGCTAGAYRNPRRSCGSIPFPLSFIIRSFPLDSILGAKPSASRSTQNPRAFGFKTLSEILSRRRCPYFDACVKGRSPSSGTGKHFVAGTGTRSGKEVASTQECLSSFLCSQCSLELQREPQSLEVGLESKYLPILFSGSDRSDSVYVTGFAADGPGCAVSQLTSVQCSVEKPVSGTTDSSRRGIKAVRNELQLLSRK